MKKTTLFVILSLAMLVFISGCVQDSASKDTSQPSAAEGNVVKINNFQFNPSTLTIKKGESVTWTNEDSVSHAIKGDSLSSLSSDSFSKGQSYTFTFNEAGTFQYHCSIHSTMKGTIIVE